MKNYKTVIGAAAMGLALAAVSGNAQVISPLATGNLNLTSGSGATLDTSLTGQELTGVSPGGNVGANNGSISTWVVSDSSIDSHGLIFIYQVVNNGIDPIDNVELTGFNPNVVIGAGSYSSLTFTSTLGASPVAGTDSTPGDPPTTPYFLTENTFGGTATFENGDLGVGGTSDFLVVLTDQPTWTGNNGQIQDSFSASGNILVPVPEANTIVAGALMLLPLGIGAVRALRKERVA